MFDLKLFEEKEEEKEVKKDKWKHTTYTAC